MKRVISVFLVIIISMSLILMTGCKKDGGGTTIDAFGKYSPAITLTYAYPFVGSGQETLNAAEWTADDTSWTKYAKSELGIDMQLLWAVNEAGAFFEKLNAQIVIGEIPDMLNVAFSEQYAYKYLKLLNEADLIGGLDDAIKDYACAEYKETLELAGPEIFYPATFDGIKKAIPHVINGNGSPNSVYWMRGDWLDAVGLKAPTNYDEFINVIKAFSTKHPDGNPNSEIFGYALGLTEEHIDTLFFGSFDAHPYIWLKDTDTTLKYGSIQPEVKTALAELASLYASKYIYPTLDGGRYVGVTSSVSGVMAGSGNYILALNELKVKNSDAELIPIKAFAHDKKTKLRVTSMDNSFRYYCVRKGYEHPEAVVKLMNMFIKISTLGDADKAIYNEYLYSADGKFHFYNLAPCITQVMKKNNTKDISARVLAALQAGSDATLDTTTEKEVYGWVKDYTDNGNLKMYPWYRMYGEGGSNHIYKEYPTETWLKNQFVNAKTATMLEKNDELKALEYITYSNIVTGVDPIDSFDTFVQQWKDLGGEQITKEVNEWYASMVGK